MKRQLITLLVMLATMVCDAQTLPEMAANEMKYWKLRGRLLGDQNNRDVYNGFMRIGMGAGMSIPAEVRGPYYGHHWEFDPLIHPNGFTEGNCANLNLWPLPGNYIDLRDNESYKGVLHWGDNPLVSLGNYIAVLATEWEILHRQGSSKAHTEWELYYALQALERLDEHAEQSLYGVANSKNGFLMRDDVPWDFALNESGKNYDYTISRNACTAFDRDDPTPSEAVFVDCDGTRKESLIFPDLDMVGRKTIRKNAMSQDEVIGVLYGLTYVHKFVPNYVSVNGTNLRTLNKQIAERIINYVKQGSNTNWWMIVDPKDKKPVCRGPFSIFFSYPLAVIGERICGTPFQNWHSINTGFPVWGAIKNIYASNVPPNDLVVAVTVPAPIQQQLGLPLNYVILKKPTEHPSAYNISMFLKLATASKTGPRPYAPIFDLKGKHTVNTISQLYKKEIYDLAGAVLYPYNPVTHHLTWHSEMLQNSCKLNCIRNKPLGSATCDYFKNDYFNPISTEGKWNVSNRYGDVHVNSSVWNDTNTIYEEFQGLDYMLAYNLYKLAYYNSGYNQKIRRYVNNTSYPFFIPLPPFFSLGSMQYPHDVKGVFSVETSNTTLNSGSNVRFYAGSDIKLNTGFHARPGSVFSANITDYDCNPQHYIIGQAEITNYKTEDTSTQTSFIDYMDTTTTRIIEDSNDIVPTPDYDSNVYIIRYSNDTVYFDLNPDYTADDEGNYFYAPQGGNNKSILVENTLDRMTLYPNPTQGQTYLEYTLYFNADIRIRVYNQLGQYMQQVLPQEWYSQERGKQHIELNTAWLTPGIYYCEVAIDGRREVKKFTVIK